MGSLWFWEPNREKSQGRNYLSIITAEAINDCEIINILCKCKVKKKVPHFLFLFMWFMSLIYLNQWPIKCRHKIRNSGKNSTAIRKYWVFICSPPAAASPCHMNLSENEAQWGIILPEYYWSVIWVPGSIRCRHRCERDNLLSLTPKFFGVLHFRSTILQAFHSSFVTEYMLLLLLRGFFR